ncbi:MAG: energy transducer TonB [Thermoanaerobaculia bacterium]
MQAAAPPELPLASESQDPVVVKEPQIRLGDLVERGPGVISPRLVRRPSPRYPSAAHRLGRQGKVSVRVLVDETGKPAEVQRVGARVGLGFDKAALEAVRKAVWEPATKNGVRVKMWIDLVIEFKA